MLKITQVATETLESDHSQKFLLRNSIEGTIGEVDSLINSAEQGKVDSRNLAEALRTKVRARLKYLLNNPLLAGLGSSLRVPHTIGR